MADRSASLLIDAEHCGPTSSGNGGWTAGLLAAHLPVAPAVTITLRSPPPLGRPLDVRAASGGRTLHDGDRLVAEAQPADPPDPVPPVDAAAAAAAEPAYPGLVRHPFPRCFVCGPEAPSGMRLSPGRTAPGRTACTWTPGDEHTTHAHVWAALDCPGGWTEDLEGRPMVLGRITAAIHRAPRADERLVVVGVLLDRAARTTRTATSVYDAAGEPVGRAAQTWVRVDPATFG